MPKRTGLKTNQEDHQRTRMKQENEEMKTRHLVEEEIARVNNLQENHNNNNKIPHRGHDGHYIIKRQVIQHHQSIMVPTMYFYQPQPMYYQHPQFLHQQPPQNARDILQQLTVENVKRVVREKQLNFLPFQQIHNTYTTSTIEFASPKSRKTSRASHKRKMRTKNPSPDDEIIIEGIRILNGPNTNNNLKISVTPDELPQRHSKDLNITVASVAESIKNLTTNPNVTLSKGEILVPETEYEYEDIEETDAPEDTANEDVPVAPTKPAGVNGEPSEDKRWNLGTFGWDFSQKRNNTGDGIFVQQLKVRRGGVAIAGPGGIATAGSGGTAIVGPGGFAYTHPGSVAIAGSGSQVVAVDPQIDLGDIVNQNIRNRTRPGAYPNRVRPPRVGRVVAIGPVIYYNRG